MQGTRDRAEYSDGLSSIISADAGNTTRTRSRRSARPDHPRGCMEHDSPIRFQCTHWGSSPRMQGTPKQIIANSNTGRIIPADAGNTPPPAHAGRPEPDHPRGCGEHTVVLIRQCSGVGSSPRMRGTRSPHNADGTTLRIIPADAGNTDYPAFGSLSARDHPRGCGEHCPITYMAYMLWGSSPRMRGTHRLCILPRGPRQDHPRGCGEHSG